MIIIFKFSKGSGITDQDRNILVNQKLLLGFLRSVAPFLKTGAMPANSETKKKRKRDDFSDPEQGTVIPMFPF